MRSAAGSGGKSLNPFEDDMDDEDGCKGDPTVAGKKKPEFDAFQRQLLKIEKEQEKRVNKIREKEKKITDKKNKEKQAREEKERKREKRRSMSEARGEARLGTMNRLSALFNFNKMNKYGEPEDQQQQEDKEDDDVPPPLPPKPDPSSPVMRSAGTRINL